MLIKERKTVAAGGYESVIFNAPVGGTFFDFLFTFNQSSIDNAITLVVKLYEEDAAGEWSYIAGATIQTEAPPEGEEYPDYTFGTGNPALGNKRYKLEYNVNKTCYFGITLTIT